VGVGGSDDFGKCGQVIFVEEGFEFLFLFLTRLFASHNLLFNNKQKKQHPLSIDLCTHAYTALQHTAKRGV
jgi:hypothetical protein